MITKYENSAGRDGNWIYTGISVLDAILVSSETNSEDERSPHEKEVDE